MGLDGSTRGGGGEDRRGVVGVGMEEEEPAGDVEDEILAQEEEEFGASEANSQARLKEKLVEISRRDDIYEYLSRSLAPSIFEMDDVKKGILLQLFGGTNKSLTKGGGAGGPRYRGDINVLLVGDPGTSKSQILQVRLDSAILIREETLTNLALSSFPVRSQDRSPRSVHFWKRFFGCRFDGLRYSRSRFEATRLREVSSFPPPCLICV